MVDNLHMFLSVADTLFDLFLIELRRIDHIDKATKLKSTDNSTTLKRYEQYLKSISIVGFYFWIGRESKTLKDRTLTGPEKLILFQQIQIVETFPEVTDGEKIKWLWRELLEINKLLLLRPDALTPSTANEFEMRSKQFVKTCCEIYPNKLFMEQLCLLPSRVLKNNIIMTS